MNAFNPIAAVKRLEASGFNRRQAEALADTMIDVKTDLVTRADLKAELNAMALRLIGAQTAVTALGVAILGVLISLNR
jgi:hypothetical protein